jgi:hypothetical protein
MQQKTPFIVIGTKGTALPIDLLRLEGNLKIGPNKIPWLSEDPSELAIKTLAWISKRGKPVDLRYLNDALMAGLVTAYFPVTWQKNGRPFTGTAYLPAGWKHPDPQPQYVAVDCPEWEYGVVEDRKVPHASGKNVAYLNFSKAKPIPPPGTTGAANDQSSFERKIYTLRYATKTDVLEHYASIKSAISAAGEFYSGNPIPIDIGASRVPDGEIDVEVVPKSTFNATCSDPNITPLAPILCATATALRDLGEQGTFRVSHRDGVLTLVSVEPKFLPTADEEQLERRAAAIIRRGSEEEPAGIAQPMRISTNQQAYVRDPRVRAYVRSRANGFCEACGKPAPFEHEDGTVYLEVHHVKPLSEGGSDRITNAVAVCPNCHRRFHFSRDKEQYSGEIFDRVQRLRRE